MVLDLDVLAAQVRAIQIEGLTWGARLVLMLIMMMIIRYSYSHRMIPYPHTIDKFVPVAYGLKMLQILTTVIDDLVSTDDIEEKVCGLEDLVQSMVSF